MQLRECDAIMLDTVCRQHKVPLLLARAYGLVGYLRVGRWEGDGRRVREDVLAAFFFTPGCRSYQVMPPSLPLPCTQPQVAPASTPPPPPPFSPPRCTDLPPGAFGDRVQAGQCH